MNIPQKIDENEVFLRFIFLDNFKKRILDIKKINAQEIFLDTRLIGVSLQRFFYSSEQQCKNYAQRIPNKQFVGFVIFYGKDFIQSVNDYQQEREEFKSILEFTPLDENNQYIIDRTQSKSDDLGNPSHSDILYINPAVNTGEPTPNTSLRLFSKKLFSKCKIAIDECPNDNEYKGIKIMNLIG